MLSSKIHGYLDYITSLFFLIAPSIFPLSETGILLAYSLAIVHFLMTIFTGFSTSLVKLIPFQLHGYVELVVSVFLIGTPWILVDFFSDVDRIFYTASGAVILVIWFLTRYETPLKE